MRVDNVTRGEILVATARVADSYWSRLRGLIGHAPLAPGEGLIIVPCNSIHTHFMGFAIDVVYVDKNHRIVGLDKDLKPWRFGRIHRRARYVIELPAGALADSGAEIGDQLAVEGYAF